MRNESSLVTALVAVVLFGIIFSNLLMELRQDVELKRNVLELELKQHNNLTEELVKLARENEQWTYSEWEKDFRVILIRRELVKSKERIQLGYQQYNKSVTVYNEKMREFPFSIIVKIRGLQEETYLETS